MKYKLLTYLLFFLSGIAFSQPLEFDIEYLNLNNGLSNNTIQSIVQDSTGFIWIGTEEGLNRYDGYEIKRYMDFPSNDSITLSKMIFKLYVDSKNNLWIGTKSGLGKLNRTTDQIEIVNSFNGINIENRVFDITENTDGYIWATAKEGAFTIGGLKNKIDRLYSNVNGINLASVNSNDIHFINDSSGVKLVKESRLSFDLFDLNGNNLIYNRTIKLKLKRNEFILDRIFADQNGNRWTLTNFKKIIIFDKDWQSQTKMIPPFLLFRLSVNKEVKFFNNYKDEKISLINKSEHKIDYFGLLDKYQKQIFQNIKQKWNIVYNDGGIVFINDSTYTYINDKTGLSDDKINNTFIEKSGAFLVSTLFNGVNLFSGISKSFNNITRYFFDGNIFPHEIKSVYSIEMSNKNIFIGTYGGLIMVNKEKYTSKIFTPDNSNYQISNKYIRTLKLIAGNLLIGYREGGFSVLDLKTMKDKNQLSLLKKADLTFNNVYDIEYDGDNIWLSLFTEGIAKISSDFKHIKQYSFVDNKRIDEENLARDILIGRDGTIWIAGGKYLNYYNKEEDKISRIPLIDENKKVNLIVGSHSLFEDSTGRIWIGTFQNGIFVYNRNTGKMKSWNTDDGLSNDIINKIFEDKAGNIWMSTNNGISKFNPDTEKFENYYKKNGLQDNEFYYDSGFQDDKGIIYFGGAKGITYFDPTNIKKNQFKPHVVFTNFLKNNKPVKLNKDISSIDTVKINYDDKLIGFEFSALSFVNSKYNKYKYILEGLNDHWIDNGYSRSAVFTNLNPGTYVLKVLASNNDEVWGTKPSAITLIVSPPYWMTFWFRALIFVIVMSIIYSFYRMRIKSFKLVEETRNRIAQNLHDEFGGRISSISFLASHLKEIIKKENNTGISKYIDKIYDEAVVVNDGLRDVVWSLDPQNDTWESLVVKYRRFASDLFINFDIDFNIVVDRIPPAKDLNPEQRINFLMTLKEFTNNIVKHSKCTKAEVFIKVNDIKIEVLIRDNGIGFNTNKSYEGSGLYNIRKRLKSLKAEYYIDSAEGQGTEAKFSFKV